MKKLLTVAGLLTVFATPALAQPFWPFNEPPHAYMNSDAAFAQAASKATESSYVSYADDTDPSRSPPPGAYNNLGR
jgi:hypothetical protein